MGVDRDDGEAAVDLAALDQADDRVGCPVHADALARQLDVPVFGERDQRLEAHHGAQRGRGLRDAPAAGEVLERVQACEQADARAQVGKRLCDLRGGELPLVAQAAGVQHEHLLRDGGLERVDDVDGRVIGHLPGDHRALQRAGEHGGDGDADDLVACGFRLLKDGEKRVRRGLGGLRVLSGREPLPEDFRGQRLAVGVAVLAEDDLHRHAGDAQLFELGGGKVGGGIGDDADAHGDVLSFADAPGARRPLSASVSPLICSARESACASPMRPTSCWSRASMSACSAR